MGQLAVFDLGKTHAKVILFDRVAETELAVLQQKNSVLPGPPYPHFDIPALQAFLLSSLQQMAQSHEIDSIFVSTHGAGVAMMAGDALVLPVLDYAFEGPDELASEYDQLRPPFSRSGTPRMGQGLNLGAQLFWLAKRFPDDMARADRLLFWPQYWAHWLSGVAASEIAYASSHSDLWDLAAQDFEPLTRFGLPDQISHPPMRLSSEVLGQLRPELAAQTGLSEQTKVYCCGHDSSLSLVSVGQDYPKPCTVLSTGTWITIFALGAERARFPEEPGLMISMDCAGQVTPNYRFPGGQIYADLVGQMRGGAAPPAAETLALADFVTAANTHVVDAATGAPVLPDAWDRSAGEVVLSRLLAAQTLQGLAAIDAQGPIVLSGPFSENQAYAEMLRAAWEAPIHVEGNLLGICKGIAACIS